MVVKKSFSIPKNSLERSDCRATSTRSTGWSNSYWWTRNTSRKSRRARLRLTALPILPLVITPTRESDPVGSRCQFAMKQPPGKRKPRSRIRAKSRLCLIRRLRSNPRRSGGPSAMGRSNRRQPLAAGAPTIAQDGTPAFGRVTAQEPMLPFPAYF